MIGQSLIPTIGLVEREEESHAQTTAEKCVVPDRCLLNANTLIRIGAHGATTTHFLIKHAGLDADTNGVGNVLLGRLGARRYDAAKRTQPNDRAQFAKCISQEVIDALHVIIVFFVKAFRNIAYLTTILSLSILSNSIQHTRLQF